MSSPATGSFGTTIQFSNGNIYMFYLDTDIPGSSWGYKISTNGGTSWSAITQFDGTLGFMVFTKGIGDTIHCVGFCDPGGTGYVRNNLFYLFFDGSAWKEIDGTTVTLPILSSGKLYEIWLYNKSESFWAQTKNIPAATLAFDSTNKPYILFTEGIDAPVGIYTYKFFNVTTGIAYSLGVTTDNWRDMAMALNCISSTHFDAYIVTGGTAGAWGGNIEKWSSLDGGVTWAKVSTVMTGQFIDPRLVLNANANGKLVLAEMIGHSMDTPAVYDWKNRGMLWGDSGFIGKRIDN
jgi:hypothetical protein